MKADCLDISADGWQGWIKYARKICSQVNCRRGHAGDVNKCSCTVHPFSEYVQFSIALLE